MTLRDALAAALESVSGRYPPPSKSVWVRDADTLLSDPAFRKALVDAVAEALWDGAGRPEPAWDANIGFPLSARCPRHRGPDAGMTPEVTSRKKGERRAMNRRFSDAGRTFLLAMLTFSATTYVNVQYGTVALLVLFVGAVIVAAVFMWLDGPDEVEEKGRAAIDGETTP